MMESTPKRLVKSSRARNKLAWSSKNIHLRSVKSSPVCRAMSKNTMAFWPTKRRSFRRAQITATSREAVMRDILSRQQHVENDQEAPSTADLEVVDVEVQATHASSSELTLAPLSLRSGKRSYTGRQHSIIRP